jgi:hypothetical protein
MCAFVGKNHDVGFWGLLTSCFEVLLHSSLPWPRPQSTFTTQGLAFTPEEAFTVKMCVLSFFQRIFYLLLQVNLHYGIHFVKIC